MSTDVPTRRRARPDRRPSRPGRRLVGWLVIVVGLVALALLVWGALSALSLYRHARAASDHVREVQSALSSQDFDGAEAATRAAAGETASASRAAGSLPLVIGAHVPGRAGHLVESVRTVVSATDLAVSEGALPLVQVASTVEDPKDLLRADGSVDVDRLRRAAANVHPAAASLARARRQIDAVDPATLPSAVRGSITSARDGVDELADRGAQADSALAVLPAALGADGPRSYLVAFQNTAELRPTGGIVGSWALVGIDDGHTQLQDVGQNDDLEALQGPARDLGAEYAALYPADKVALSQDLNLSPHFPHAGRLLSDLWVAQGRPAPDGVIAVDPSGLAPLLRGAGDVAVPGGPSVNADNVVDVLLRQAYQDFDGDYSGRKQYLSTVIGTAFASALGGGVFNASTLHGLLDATEAGHLVAWSPDAGEEAALARAGIAGALPRPSADTAGVYLTNVAASKLDYYLTETVQTSGGCTGTPATMRVTLHNAAPPKVPDYVANKEVGVARTTESVLVALYVPPQRGIAQVRVDGRSAAFSAGTERGWSLARLTVQVPRDADVTVDVDLSGAAAPIDHVLTQPMVRAPAVSTGNCAQ